MSLAELERSLKELDEQIASRTESIRSLRKICRIRPLPPGATTSKDLYVHKTELDKLLEKQRVLLKEFVLEKRRNENLPSPTFVDWQGRILKRD